MLLYFAIYFAFLQWNVDSGSHWKCDRETGIYRYDFSPRLWAKHILSRRCLSIGSTYNIRRSRDSRAPKSLPNGGIDGVYKAPTVCSHDVVSAVHWQHNARGYFPCSIATTTMASTFPDYYDLLNVAQTATQDEIRTAYKKESLKCVSLLR